MIIIGCDYHSSFQQIACVDAETGEIQERKLMHSDGEAERFYRELTGAVRVGLESTGNCHWFLDLLAGLGHEVWVGDAARISARQVRQQRTESAVWPRWRRRASWSIAAHHPISAGNAARVLLWYWLAARSQELAAYV